MKVFQRKQLVSCVFVPCFLCACSFAAASLRDAMRECACLERSLVAMANPTESSRQQRAGFVVVGVACMLMMEVVRILKKGEARETKSSFRQQ